jgi:phospholipid/cholesterol/gamma-HCH transport system substrate-binding protein
MTRALREHLRDVVAIIALTAAGLFAGFVILANQRASIPEWVPVFGQNRFELKAELSTAQAVTPGQGQTVVVAGIRVGDIAQVELEEGHAVVTMDVENEYAPLINEDASMLLRPKTGLQDMVLEVDPGVSDEDIEEGSTVPLASTLPNVNPDEFLASLDADTQAFLKLLLAGGATALDPEQGRDRKLASALRQFEPFARDIARLNQGLAQRRESISRSIHNFRLLSDELAAKDADLTAFVDSSDAVLQRFANQEASIRAALRELPGTLKETKGALKVGNKFALNALPATRDSLPGARALKPALEALQPFLTETVAPIRDQIRPFTTQVIAPVTDLRKATSGLGKTIPPLRVGFTRLNEIFNALAANPEGSAESYLFYVPWLNHNVNLIGTPQDSQGNLLRGLIMNSCKTARLADGVFATVPYIFTLAQATRFPMTPEIC